MENKKSIFIDTNVFVYYLSKEYHSAQNLLDTLIETKDYNLYINDIVISEIALVLLKLQTSKKSYDLKHNKNIVKNADKSYLEDIVSVVEILPTNKPIIYKALQYMNKYGLLPNDAIILASCKLNNITYLATYDEDFKEAAKKENIKIITSSKEIK